MHHSVEDGISSCGVGFKAIVPVNYRDLRGYDCRLATVAVLDDFHQVEYLLVVELLDAEVIYDYQIVGCDLLEQFRSRGLR